MTITEIRRRQAEIVAQARSLIDEITPRTSASRARELEAQHDRAMDEHDRLERLANGEQRGGHSPDEATDEQRKRAFDHYLRYGIANMPNDLRAVASRLQSEARTFVGQGTGVEADGGYLVPTGFMPELVKSLKAYGPMVDGSIVRQLITRSGNAIPWPNVDDTGNMGSQIAENTQATLSEITFGSKTLNAYKYTSGTVIVSNELLQDSALDPEVIIRDLMAERIGRRGNYDLTVGDGSSKPNGIAHAATSGVTAASPTSVTFDEIIDLEHAVDPLYRTDPSCRYMFSDATLKVLRKLKDGEDRYVWNPADVKTGAPATLNNYPYSINQDMPAATAGNKSVLFGAFNRYVHRQVQQFSIRRLNERYADYDQVGFIGFTRFDGDLIDAGAVKALTQAAS